MLQISFCGRTNTYRIRGQWAPEQLQFFDDTIHPVEVTVDEFEQIRGGVVQVLREFGPLLRLSANGAVRRARRGALSED